MEELFSEATKIYEFDIKRMEVVEDHVHIFIGAAPKYSLGEIERGLKSTSAEVVFREFPEAREELWGGEFCSDGYFVRSVGDEVTADFMRKYIGYNEHKQLAFDF